MRKVATLLAISLWVPVAQGGFTALHWAAMNNCGERGALVVKQLLLWNADPSLQNKVGDAALDLAVRFGNQEVAAVLNLL